MVQVAWERLPNQLESLRKPWLNDDEAQECPGLDEQGNSCQKKFSLTVRKHHCRGCGKIFCNGCSSQTSLFVPGYTARVRVCRDCHARFEPAKLGQKPAKNAGSSKSPAAKPSVRAGTHKGPNAPSIASRVSNVSGGGADSKRTSSAPGSRALDIQPALLSRTASEPAPMSPHAGSGAGRIGAGGSDHADSTSPPSSTEHSTAQSRSHSPSPHSSTIEADTNETKAAQSALDTAQSHAKRSKRPDRDRGRDGTRTPSPSSRTSSSAAAANALSPSNKLSKTKSSSHMRSASAVPQQRSSGKLDRASTLSSSSSSSKRAAKAETAKA